jgi:hypothetical protein
MTRLETPQSSEGSHPAILFLFEGGMLLEQSTAIIAAVVGELRRALRGCEVAR